MSQKKSEEEMKGVRRIVDLEVNEVSLVDKPAIQRKFLIVKRMEEEPMAAPKEVKSAATAPEAVKKAEPEAGKPEGDVTKPEVEAKPEPAPEAPKPEAPVPDAKPEPAPEAPKPEAEPVAKTDAYTMSVTPEGDVKVNGTLAELRKAKVFTGSRTQALKDVILSLADLLGEVDTNVLKEVHDKMGGAFKPDLSSGIQPPAGPAPVSVTKAEDVTKPAPEAEPKVEAPKVDASADELRQQITAVQKNLDALMGRLEVIEKARVPSQSIEGSGGTDDKNKNVQKSFWHGVI